MSFFDTSHRFISDKQQLGKPSVGQYNIKGFFSQRNPSFSYKHTSPLNERNYGSIVLSSGSQGKSILKPNLSQGKLLSAPQANFNNTIKFSGSASRSKKERPHSGYHDKISMRRLSNEPITLEELQKRMNFKNQAKKNSQRALTQINQNFASKQNQRSQDKLKSSQISHRGFKMTSSFKENNQHANEQLRILESNDKIQKEQRDFKNSLVDKSQNCKSKSVEKKSNIEPDYCNQELAYLNKDLIEVEDKSLNFEYFGAQEKSQEISKFQECDEGDYSRVSIRDQSKSRQNQEQIPRDSLEINSLPINLECCEHSENGKSPSIKQGELEKSSNDVEEVSNLGGCEECFKETLSRIQSERQIITRAINLNIKRLQERQEEKQSLINQSEKRILMRRNSQGQLNQSGSLTRSFSSSKSHNIMDNNYFKKMVNHVNGKKKSAAAKLKSSFSQTSLLASSKRNNPVNYFTQKSNQVMQIIPQHIAPIAQINIKPKRRQPLKQSFSSTQNLQKQSGLQKSENLLITRTFGETQCTTGHSDVNNSNHSINMINRINSATIKPLDINNVAERSNEFPQSLKPPTKGSKRTSPRIVGVFNNVESRQSNSNNNCTKKRSNQMLKLSLNRNSRKNSKTRFEDIIEAFNPDATGRMQNKGQQVDQIQSNYIFAKYESQVKQNSIEKVKQSSGISSQQNHALRAVQEEDIEKELVNNGNLLKKKKTSQINANQSDLSSSITLFEDSRIKSQKQNLKICSQPNQILIIDIKTVKRSQDQDSLKKGKPNYYNQRQSSTINNKVKEINQSTLSGSQTSRFELKLISTKRKPLQAQNKQLHTSKNSQTYQIGNHVMNANSAFSTNENSVRNFEQLKRNMSASQLQILNLFQKKSKEIQKQQPTPHFPTQSSDSIRKCESQQVHQYFQPSQFEQSPPQSNDKFSARPSISYLHPPHQNQVKRQPQGQTSTSIAPKYNGQRTQSDYAQTFSLSLSQSQLSQSHNRLYQVQLSNKESQSKKRGEQIQSSSAFSINNKTSLNASQSQPNLQSVEKVQANLYEQVYKRLGQDRHREIAQFQNALNSCGGNITNMVIQELQNRDFENNRVGGVLPSSQQVIWEAIDLEPSSYEENQDISLKTFKESSQVEEHNRYVSPSKILDFNQGYAAEFDSSESPIYKGAFTLQKFEREQQQNSRVCSMNSDSSMRKNQETLAQQNSNKHPAQRPGGDIDEDQERLLRNREGLNDAWEEAASEDVNLLDADLRVMHKEPTLDSQNATFSPNRYKRMQNSQNTKSNSMQNQQRQVFNRVAYQSLNTHKVSRSDLNREVLDQPILRDSLQSQGTSNQYTQVRERDSLLSGDQRDSTTQSYQPVINAAEGCLISPATKEFKLYDSSQREGNEEEIKEQLLRAINLSKHQLKGIIGAEDGFRMRKDEKQYQVVHEEEDEEQLQEEGEYIEDIDNGYVCVSGKGERDDEDLDYYGQEDQIKQHLDVNTCSSDEYMRTGEVTLESPQFQLHYSNNQQTMQRSLPNGQRYLNQISGGGTVFGQHTGLRNNISNIRETDQEDEYSIEYQNPPAYKNTNLKP